MKTLKIVSKIVGVLWMVFFGISALFTLKSQAFDFSSFYGIGYFVGMLLALLIIVSIGFFLFRWGAKKPAL
tara:strand:- start:137 stop:349 length:213 start_codon:yes stop_codon:yes gene_type:complete